MKRISNGLLLGRTVNRRTFVAGTVGLLSGALLAACGDDDDDDAQAEDQPDPTATPAEDDATEADEESTSGNDEDAGDEESSGDTRPFEHALGETPIPVDPQDVAVLNIIALDAAMLTGFTPVAALIARDMPWRSDVDAIEVKLDYEVDVEQLLQADPDLILDGAYEGGLFTGIEPATLEEVAPVVAYDFENDLEWPEYFLFYADALNRLDQARDVLQEYEDRVASIQEQLGENPPRVALLRVRIDGVLNYTQVGFAARIFDDLDLPAWDQEEWEFSLERVNEIDADIIYLFGSEDDEEALQSMFDEVTSSPVWQSHPAVESGNTHAVDDYWFGFGPTEAMLVLDDLEQTLLSGDAASDAFPVTIENKFGTTEITEPPQRVLTIGFSEQDPVLALGVQPIAVREWFGEQPYAVWPWAEDELGDAEPEVLVMAFGELDFELVAGLEPDLIVATHSGILEEEYTTLADIAPTLAQPGDYPDFGVPWQEQTRLIGRALGKEERAEELVAEVEDQIAQVAEEHPEFDGATIAWASPTGDGQYYATGSTTPPMRFLSQIGFGFPPELDEFVGDASSGTVSEEQMNLLEADVLIMQANSEDDRAAIEEDPLYQQLNVAQEGRTIFFVGLDDPLYGALSFSTVLSLPFAVDNLVPLLEAAVDGDPDTEVSE